MAKPSNSHVVVAALVAAVSLVVGAWWALSAPPDGEVPATARPTAVAPSGGEEQAATGERSAKSGSAPEPLATSSAKSTVAWPVKVDLELIRAAHVPKVKGLDPMGSGANARLSGRLSRGDRGVVGQVTFIGGANLGRVLECSSNGEFGAIDLYPGLAEVKITGPGIESIREVLLRGFATEQLNISYDFPGSVTGQVFDRDAQPLANVDVELDGQHVSSDEQGLFHFASAVGGERVRIVLRKQGYATRSDVVGVASGRPLGKERFTYTLQPAASLAIHLGPRIGGAGDSTVVISPEVQGIDRVYPWHRISPLRMPPGGTQILDDLPAMRVTVRVYHEGALANPESATVFLRVGEVAHHEVRFEPGPSVQGVVIDEEGRRVERARVVCEAPDRLAATHQYLQRTQFETMAEILPPLPMGAGEVITNFNGEFQLSTWPGFGAMRYLWAESADGKRWGGRAIATDGTTPIELVVKPVADGQWSVSLDFPGRHQGVPVIASVSGAARPEVIVPEGDPLVIKGLAAGSWRIRASWNGKPIFGPEGQTFDLDGDHLHSVPLPEGAIEGQDEDTLLRAGRLSPTRSN